MPTTSRDTSRRRVRLATILFIVAGLAGATAHVVSAATKPIGDATAAVETDPVASAGDAPTIRRSGCTRRTRRDRS